MALIIPMLHHKYFSSYETHRCLCILSQVVSRWSWTKSGHTEKHKMEWHYSVGQFKTLCHNKLSSFLGCELLNCTLPSHDSHILPQHPPVWRRIRKNRRQNSRKTFVILTLLQIHYFYYLCCWSSLTLQLWLGDILIFKRYSNIIS